jgi:ADP-ribose pyrophosphatase YjhB (NUDIX family)
MTNELLTTWDGLPISPDAPFGASIIVYRRGPQGVEFLVLHRAHEGPDYEGEWAWTPPSGARLPNEPVDDCAQRELREETGLSLPMHATGHGLESWAIYWAEANVDDPVILDAEHDRYAWVTLDEALARCLPVRVGEGVAHVARMLSVE